MTAAEAMAGFNSRHAGNKPRNNWRQACVALRAEVAQTREDVINEAIAKLRDEMRSKPKNWRFGYYSAITQLELIK